VIYLSNSTHRHRLNPGMLKRCAARLLAAVGEPASSLSIALVGDRAIRRLNRAHRGQDRATDVLSFSLAEPAARGRRASDAPERMLGDVVISLDRAARQAAEYDASLAAEVQRLLIHGILHLLGHDHEIPRERVRMVREERRLAASIGLSWPYAR
jgi:probable rRNA maturation factor